MKEDPDKMDDLQKMLALKRHETPPPRFFKGFSDQVIHRLHTPEPAGSQTWWQRLGLDIDSKPVLVCTSAVVVCALLLVGLIVSLQVSPPKAAPRSPSDTTHFVVAPPVSAHQHSATDPGPLPGTGELPKVGQPVVTPVPSPFNRPNPPPPLPSAPVPSPFNRPNPPPLPSAPVRSGAGTVSDTKGR